MVVCQGVHSSSLLTDRKGNVVSKNEYAIAEVMDKHDWSKYRWWRTQMQSYADFSALDNLAPAEVAISDLKLLIQSREQHIPHRFRMERC